MEKELAEVAPELGKAYLDELAAVLVRSRSACCPYRVDRGAVEQDADVPTKR